MDRIGERLREDAAGIDVAVSPELDARIRASLERVAEEQHRPARHRPKSFGLWWLSTLTGAALAAALIVAVNLRSPGGGQQAAPVEPPVVAELELPAVPLKIQPAVLTRPLEEEYELLQSDIEKAGATVRESLEQVF
jgi:hypothetical protein